MKSPGNFLIIDDETSRLLQTLARFHPQGNKRVLVTLLNFYVKLAKKARSKGADPLAVLADIASGDFSAVELKKIKRIESEMREGQDISPSAEKTPSKKASPPPPTPRREEKSVKFKGSEKSKSSQDYRKQKDQKKFQ